ncbi:MAG: DUF6506 family protein [Christensenella sp.]
MKKSFAFLLMGEHYDPSQHCAKFETEKQTTYIYTVKNIKEAYAKIDDLAANGVGAIELCGAFGEETAHKIIEMTNGKIAIGFVTHFPQQDAVFAEFFQK